MLLVVGAGGPATPSTTQILPAAGGAPFFTRGWRGELQRQEALIFLLISFIETLLINVVILGNLRNLRFYFNRLKLLLMIFVVFELWR